MHRLTSPCETNVRSVVDVITGASGSEQIVVVRTNLGGGIS